MRRRHSLAAASAFAAVGLVSSLLPVAAAATSSPSGKATAGSAQSAPASSSFYTPPASLPAGNGKLVRSEPMNTLLNFPGKASRIMYTSTDGAGKRVAVTGTYFQPVAPWHGPGPRPLVTMGSGTIGQGDQCAPSKLMQLPLSLTPGPSLGLNYEHLTIQALLAKGVAIVETDYVGLGTPGTHTYMARGDQAHAMLDAARVARSVPGSDVKANSNVGTYGYSQGGGASGAADELAPKYAPDVKLVAGYVGAPPADLMHVFDGIDGSSIMGVLGYYTNGLVARHPEVKSFLDANLNAKGQAMLKKVSNQCLPDTALTYGFHHSTEWMKSGETLKAAVARTPFMLALLNQEHMGAMKPSVPVRVATGVHDDIVPHAQAKQLAVDWCGKGANVTYAPIPGLNLGDRTVLNHLEPLYQDLPAASNWMVDRLANKPTTNNCSSVAGMH